ADDDVVGVLLEDRVAVLVQRGEQPAFADDECGAACLLLSEETGGGHRTGENVLLLDLDAHAGELADDVAARALAVVRQKSKRDFAAAQLVHEAVSPGNQLRAAIHHAVHVDQVTVPHRCLRIRVPTLRLARQDWNPAPRSTRALLPPGAMRPALPCSRIRPPRPGSRR